MGEVGQISLTLPQSYLKKKEDLPVNLFTFFFVQLCARAKSLQSCSALCDPMDHCLPGSSVDGESPGRNTGVGCHALLQGVFPTQGLNPLLLLLLHWQAGSPPPVTSDEWAFYCVIHEFNEPKVPWKLGLSENVPRGRALHVIIRDDLPAWGWSSFFIFQTQILNKVHLIILSFKSLFSVYMETLGKHSSNTLTQIQWTS